MFMPAWAIRLAPYAAGILLAVGAYFWAYSNGKQSERAKWQKAEIAAVVAAQAHSAAMQAQVDAAGAALSEQTAAIDQLTSAARVTTRNYYVQNPAANVACLSADRLRAIADSDTAVTAASTTQ
jgi:hypothetical protein